MRETVIVVIRNLWSVIGPGRAFGAFVEIGYYVNGAHKATDADGGPWGLVSTRECMEEARVCRLSSRR
jgi:hypothetical protein